MENNPIIYKGVPVVTTEMLCSELNVESFQIKHNFSNNKKFYKENEDYFILKGTDLKAFILQGENLSLQISSKTRSLYLWTESGSMNQVKSLQNDEAWNVFINFRNRYFRQKEALKAVQEQFTFDKQLAIHSKKEVQVSNSKSVNSLNFLEGGLEKTTEYNTISCVLHAGCTPKAIKKRYLQIENAKRKANNKRLIKSTPSAKEILREKRPEIAASMSVTDYLVQMGGDLKECALLSVSTQGLFLKMMELGAGQKNLLNK